MGPAGVRVKRSDRVESCARATLIRAIGGVEQPVVQQDEAVATVCQFAAGQGGGQLPGVPDPFRHPADLDLFRRAAQVAAIEPEELVELPRVERRLEQGHHVLGIRSAYQGDETLLPQVPHQLQEPRVVPGERLDQGAAQVEVRGDAVLLVQPESRRVALHYLRDPLPVVVAVGDKVLVGVVHEGQRHGPFGQRPPPGSHVGERRTFGSGEGGPPASGEWTRA